MGTDPETITVTVTDETTEVQGVTTTVVHDVVTGAGRRGHRGHLRLVRPGHGGQRLVLRRGPTEYDESGRADTAGSWEAGVDGAQAGIVMLAEPRVGDGYQQEFLEGVAEDRATVLSLAEAVNVPAGSFPDVLQTEESTPLEPGLVERKYYARGVGLVFEETVSGGFERVELVELTQP